MKRITLILLIVLFVFGLSCFSIVSADVTAANSKLVTDSPRTFYAYGFEYIDSGEAPPFHKLQNIMEIEFSSGQEIQRQYTVEFNDSSVYGPATHIITLNLTYDQDSLKLGLPFITGSFNYYWERNGVETEYTGTIQGELIEIATDIMGFNTGYVYTNAIALDLEVDGDPWDWTIYLEVPGEEEYYQTGYMEDDYDHHHESSPHVPSPSTQADVAAGVGISTAGIAIANALTKTSIFGSASFNTTLTPQSAAAAPAAPTAPRPVQTSSGGGFFGAIKDFFKNLFANLRDMMTDEGRSFASGKLSDFLEDAEMDNSDIDSTGDEN